MSDTAVTEAATTTDAKTGNTPLVKRQFGNISVAVFAREVSRPDGTVFTAKDFVLQKSWKDKNDQWQSQSLTIKPRELFAVQQALTMAYVDCHNPKLGEEMPF